MPTFAQQENEYRYDEGRGAVRGSNVYRIIVDQRLLLTVTIAIRVGV